jgi:hypothetical protein
LEFPLSVFAMRDRAGTCANAVDANIARDKAGLFRRRI